MWQIGLKAAGLAGVGLGGAMLAGRGAGLVVERRVLEGKLPDVFDYISDFSTTQKWDPGVISAVHNQRIGVSDDDARLPQVGDTFDLVTTWKGAESAFTYTILELERPRRVVLEGHSSLFKALDTIEFSEDSNGGVVIDYRLQLSLRGPLRPFTFALGLISKDLQQLGLDSLDGMSRACAENAATKK